MDREVLLASHGQMEMGTIAMDLNILFLCVGAGYLIGSISFARLIGRLMMPEEDLTLTQFDIAGSEEKLMFSAVSATSLSARGGPKAGCTVAILDMAKAALPMWLIQSWYPDQPLYMLLLGLAVVIGHNYPLFHRFVGGRGISSIIGSLLVIDPLSIPVTLITSIVIGLAGFKDMVIVYTGWLFLLIPWLWWRTDSWLYPAYAAALIVVVFVALRPELNQYYRLKRAGELDKAGSIAEALEGSDFGRPIKYLRRWGLIKDNPSE